MRGQTQLIPIKAAGSTRFWPTLSKRDWVTLGQFTQHRYSSASYLQLLEVAPGIKMLEQTQFIPVKAACSAHFFYF